MNITIVRHDSGRGSSGSILRWALSPASRWNFSSGRTGHWCSAFLVFLGSWLSGYFIVATDAWMQHPTGYRFAANGAIELSSFGDLLLNKWALWQYAHTMLGAVQTGCFVMAGVGAFYLLTKRDEIYGRTFVRA